MRTIIAGGRANIRIADVIDAIHKSKFPISEVVSGRATGVDEIGEWLAAVFFDYQIPVVTFPARWETFGRAAGPIRNEQMAKYADALILVWDGQSRGSRSMLEMAQAQASRRTFHIFNHIVP